MLKAVITHVSVGLTPVTPIIRAITHEAVTPVSPIIRTITHEGVTPVSPTSRTITHEGVAHERKNNGRCVKVIVYFVNLRT